MRIEFFKPFQIYTTYIQFVNIYIFKQCNVFVLFIILYMWDSTTDIRPRNCAVLKK
jgi:hypothetical protein